MLGRQLINKDLSQTEVEVDLSHFQNGVYLIKIKVNDEVEINKIIKD